MNRPKPHLQIVRSDSAAFAIADQLCMVGANFVLTILVARHSSQEDFATFSILYSLVVLLSFLHGPLINEPLALSSRNDTSLLSGFRADRATALIFVPISTLIVVFAYSQQYSASPLTLSLLCAAGITSCAYWSAKSGLHALSKHRAAFVASAIGSAALVATGAAGIAYCYSMVDFALAAISIAALSGYITAQLFLRHSVSPQLKLSVVASHSRIGIPAASLVWLAGNVTALALANQERLEEVAGLRVVLTLLLPINQIMTGMSSFLLPRLARLRGDGLSSAAQESTSKVLLAGTALSIAFAAFTYPFAGFLLERIYGADYIRYRAWLQIGAAVLPLSWTVVTVLRTHFRGSAQATLLLKVYIACLVIALPVSLVILQSDLQIGPIVSFITIQAILALGFLLTFVRTRS